MLELTSEDDLESEIQQADDFKDEIYFALAGWDLSQHLSPCQQLPHPELHLQLTIK